MSDKRIKLVEIIADSELGGGPIHILGILKHIDKEVFDVHLICPTGYLSSEAKRIKGIEVHNVRMVSKFDLLSFLKIKEILATIRIKYDPFGPMIVHSHGPRAGFLARIVMPRGIRNIYTEHLLTGDFHLKNSLNEWIQKKVLARFNQRTDLIITVSSAVYDFLVKNKLSPRRRTIVIPNGIDLLEAQARGKASKIKLDQKHPVIGAIGNLNIQKGQKYLIQAMAEIRKKYPLATLEILGEGHLRESLANEAKRLGLSHHVSLIGYEKDFRDYFKHWSVFAMPSISETFGIAILEAMHAGLPVVASKVGGIPDIITNKKDGLLVPPHDPKTLAKAITDIIEHPAMAAKLKNEGKKRAEDFDWKKIIIQLEKEYLKLFVQVSGSQPSLFESER